MKKLYLDETKNLIEFVKKSPDAFHAIDNIKQTLLESGYTELLEKDSWSIAPGGKYFITRNLSSVIAFRVPEGTYRNFMIIASHSDSPTYKIKPNCEMRNQKPYVSLNVEGYGGMIASTWMDRPLSVSGRVLVETDNGVETKLVKVDRDFLVIPNIAIHMNRTVNDGYAFNAQKDMLPLLGENCEEGAFLKTVAESANVDPKDIIGYDLFLYNRMVGTIWGNDDEYFSVGRIDNLQCAYSSLHGFLQGEPTDSISVYAVFDNEEVGSGSKQGALSTFLIDSLERINEALGFSKAKLHEAAAAGFMVSADNGHAMHPNLPEKADPINRPLPNHGVVIKHSANQKYTTDAVADAVFKKICKKADVPVQVYTNRSDIIGGSTLGNLSTQQMSINMVDIGMAQLAMHSSYETGGTMDTTYLINASKAFYNSTIDALCDGNYIVK